MDAKKNLAGGIGKRAVIAVAAAFAVSCCLTAAGCGEVGAEREDLILATTTSTQDSGLLDAWIPMFEEDNPYAVKVIAVGSGRAMEMGRRGECDVMLAHDPAEEEKMVAEGYAVDRRAVMHNYFRIVGPAPDPAGVKGAADAVEAFRRIAAAQQPFISRGDGSGTHERELEVWEEAGIEPRGGWYAETGKGMADTLRVASEKRAYTLADGATYLKLGRDLELEVLLEGDERLRNDYHVMNVDPRRFPQANYRGAQAFNAFCVSRKAQELLMDFGVEEFGRPLFEPDALEEQARKPGAVPAAAGARRRMWR